MKYFSDYEVNNQIYRSTKPKEVYRDKHTLVEVTIHRNPRAGTSKQESRRISPESLSDSETQFRKPRSGQDCPRRDRSRGARVPNKENIKSKAASKIQRLCEQPDCSEFEKKIHELEFSLEKSKLETSRYRKEYNVMVKQVDISKGTVTSLERQVTDLKRIISKLTSSNGELLEIVGEKINYEDKIEALEHEREVLARQLREEQSISTALRQRLEDVEAEVQNLRSLAQDLRAGLTTAPTPVSAKVPPAPEIGDETRQILGLDLPTNEEDADSAYEDPRTDSIRSRTRTEQIKRIEPQVFHQLNVELSESEDPKERKALNDDIDSAVKELSLKFDQIEIPQPRPFEGSSLHLSLSSSDSDQQTLMSTLSEGKFLKGLEQSIDLSATKYSSQSE